MLKGIHHIAFVVEDLDAATRLFVDVFGGSLKSRTYFEPGGVEVSLVSLGNVLFELARPIRPGTDTFNYMKEHGPGFYHLGFLVDDIPDALARLEAGGVGLIDRTAVSGVDWDVAWLRTESVLHVPAQLIRPKKGQA